MDDRALLKIKEISERVDSLAETNRALLLDNKKLLGERERLINERAQHTKQIENLRYELRTLKLAYNLVGGSKEKAKAKIKAILREIDVCISLISK